MFIPLFKKTFLYWKRNKVGSIIEIVLPIILGFVIWYLRTIAETTEYEEQSYEKNEFATSFSVKDFPANYTIKNRFKDCDLNSGGRVGLAPKNEITEVIGNFFKTESDYNVVYFENDDEINKYIKQDDYINAFENGTKRQLCFAISFDEYDLENNLFEYNLRFNISANPTQVSNDKLDHFDTKNETPKLQFQVDDNNEFINGLEKGPLSLQILVDAFILDKKEKYLEQSVAIRKMKTPNYVFRKLLLLEPACIYVFLFEGIIVFLRFISQVVGEREARTVENMENMGMRKIDYILGTIAFNAVVQFFLGIVVAGILSIGFFKATSYFVLLITYYVFVYNMMMLGLLVSCFFSQTKKAIVSGICLLFFFYIFYVIRDNLRRGGERLTTIMCISPIGAMAQVVVNYIVFEATDAGFTFNDYDKFIFNFRGKTFFYFGIAEIIIFFFLGLYFFHVVPLEIGIPQHPLFCLGFPFKKKKKKELDQSTIALNNDELGKSRYFEKIENELKNQRNNKKTILIKNLRKVYGNKKVAVNNLSFEMFSNQIFSLLGHNGAGKTTTISMISGFLNKTSGIIKIYGLDSTEERNEIKKLIGVCPQKNPIFSYMTVYEHVILYAKIKGVKKDLIPKVEEVLKDIDLWHKKDYWAMDLSGGQKRKLCIAMAFIGDSKIILLDEPTSGMDTYARRLLWEMIKKYKMGRLIILTTHNMDEADYLGDRIGIMAEGKMVTCGSSLFLKNEFGAGYELTIVKRNGLSSSKAKIIQNIVKDSCSGSRFLGDVGTEMRYQLPTENSGEFSTLFRILEDDKERLGIEAFGISLTTLEEVFLRVCNGTGEVNEEQKQKEKIRIEKELEDNKDIESKDLASLRLKNNSLIFALQVGALIKKRIIYFSRDIGGVFCEILLPIIIVIIGLTFTKIKFFSDAPTLEFKSNLYPYQFRMNNLQKGSTNLSEKLINLFEPTNLDSEIIQTKKEDEFNDLIFENRQFNQNYAYFLKILRKSEYSYTLFVNSTSPFGGNVAINNMNNALLKYYSQDNNAKIRTKIKPFPEASGTRDFEAGFDGFVIVLLIGIAYTFIPASMIVFIIKEREKNAKHQQLVSGVNVFAYWLSNFIVDFIKYLIPALTTIALIYIYDIEFFTERDHSTVIFALFLLYGVAIVLFVYTMSFFFKDPAKGQIILFLLSAFFSTFVVILSYILRMIDSTRSFAMNFLEYLLLFMPQFAFGFGLLHLPNINLYLFYFKWDRRHKAFSGEVSGKSVLYLAIVIVILIIVIILMELSYKIYPYLQKSQNKKITKFMEDKLKNKHDNLMKNNKNSNLFTSEKEEEEDLDVQEEERQVKDHSKNWSVRVIDLKKVYSIGGFMGFRVRKHKMAVKGISFGITPGTVFGLLGTNGAGKTSTFKMLTGDVFPSSGYAEVMGYKMPENLAKIRHLIGYCPQFDSILDKLTSEEHLYMYCSLKGINPTYHRYLVDQLIETMNLTKFRHVQAGTYSGGNKRKLSVAIAMLGKPPIIFLDEPSSGMDPAARRFMWGVINDISIKKKHSSIILTTHSMEEAEALSSKLAIMVEGKIKTIGSVQQLKKKYGKCFELELKMELPTDEEIEIKKKDLFEKLGAEKNELNLDDLKIILEKFDKEDLFLEIKHKGKGHFINLELEKRGVVKAELFIEWLDLNEKFSRIYTYLKDHFEGTELLESLQSFAKFKVPDTTKLSKIFKELETYQKILSIQNYSVKQISLEQIFVKFAETNNHPDDE